MEAMLERLAVRHPVLSLDAIETILQEDDSVAVDVAHNAMTLWLGLRERLLQAGQDGALSLHLEPEGEQLRIRQRLITGLEEIRVAKKAALAQVIPLVAGKLRQGSENKGAARGFLVLNLDRRPLVVETLLLPCVQGDTLHLRLFLEPDARPRLDELGMDTSQSRQCREFLLRPNGLIVVCGHDSLERQRTIRAMAQELISPDRRTLSVEPTVHPVIPGCLQIPVSECPWDDDVPEATLIDVCDIDGYFLAAEPSSEWSSWLLDEALDAALVVQGSESTDSARVLGRLLAQGATPVQLAQSLTAIISQQAVFGICSQCSRPASIDPGCERLPLDSASMAARDVSTWLSHSMTHQYVEAEGCEACRQSGHGDALQIFTITPVNLTARTHLMEGKTDMAARALDAGKALAARAMTLAQDSRISLPEAVRVSREHQRTPPRF